jgi:hypothetical protein
MKKLILTVMLIGSTINFLVAQDGTSVSVNSNTSDKIEMYSDLVNVACTNGHAGDANMIMLSNEIKCLLTEDQAMSVDQNLVRPNVRQSLCHNEWPEVITVSKADLAKFGSSYNTYNKKFPSTSATKGTTAPKTNSTR